MSRPKGVPTAKTNCPHCGKELSTIRIWTHERICFRNPKVRPLIVAAMSSKKPGEGVTMSQYSVVTSGDTRTPDVTTLRRATGARDWAGVLAEFGLVPQTPDQCPTDAPAPRTEAQRAEDAACKEVDDWRAQAREILRQERYHLYGFTVLSVRDLPGVTVNGKPCVAVTLR